MERMPSESAESPSPCQTTVGRFLAATTAASERRVICGTSMSLGCT